MQIRSPLQHVWATAVETVGTFLQQALKSSEGEEKWLRFFALMGSVFALREGRPTVPGTPTSAETLAQEIKDLSTRLDVEGRLRRYGSALTIPEHPIGKGGHYFLLRLQPNETTLWVKAFSKHQLSAATSAYLETESEIRGKGGQVVLVSVDSLKLLRRAYPNYYLDTDAFLRGMRRALS